MLATPTLLLAGAIYSLFRKGVLSIDSYPERLLETLVLI
jgi:hypothetical protein